jgi:hypothetical protein
MTLKINIPLMLFLSFAACTNDLQQPSWNNPVDTLGTNYLPPKTAAIGDTSVDINDTLVLRIVSADTHAVIKRYLWSEDTTHWDSSADSSKRLAWFSWKDTSVLVWYKVIDKNGLVSNAKYLTVHVFARLPVIKAPASLVVRWDQEATVSVEAADSNGTVKKYLWNISGSPVWDTTSIPVRTIRHAEGGKIVIRCGAMDDDGLLSYDSTSILFNQPPIKISLMYPKSLTRCMFDEIDFSDTIGKILCYGLQAADPDSAADSLRFVCELSDTLTHVIRRKTVSDSFWLDSLLPDRCYKLAYKAIDRGGDSIERQCLLLTQNFFPKGMRYFPRDLSNGVAHPFWIDTTEVTQGEWAAVMHETIDSVNVRFPKIVKISYNSVSPVFDFFYKLNSNYFSENTMGYRLPVGEEWCRAYKNPDNMSPYYWGSSINPDVVKKYAWYCRNADSAQWTSPHAATSGPQPVARLLPNEYGLYDMAGNVGDLIGCGMQHSSKCIWGSLGGSVFSDESALGCEHNDFKLTGYKVASPAGFRKVFGAIIPE